jgi:acetolactate synthase regulatory subunit
MSELKVNLLFRDVEGALLRVLGAVERRGCRILQFEAAEGRDGLMEATLRLASPVGKAHRIRCVLSQLIDVHSVSAVPVAAPRLAVAGGRRRS